MFVKILIDCLVGDTAVKPGDVVEVKDGYGKRLIANKAAVAAKDSEIRKAQSADAPKTEDPPK